MNRDDMGLGRRLDPDPRDRNFMMSQIVVPPGEGIQRRWRYWWPSGQWRDQGATGTCVGHAWSHWVEDGPVTHPGDIDPMRIYMEACRRDVWPENDPFIDRGGNETVDWQFGTSVRAAAKYLQEIGRIGTYRWSWDFGTVRDHLLLVGPVVVGSYWFESMFWPDTDGHVTVDGDVVGGHAYVVNGINTDRRIVRIKNSWGRGWGRNGYGYITFDDMARLVGDGGEAVTAVELPTG